MGTVVPVIIPAIIAIKRRKIIDAFRIAGAVNADAARKPEDLGVSRNHMFRRLIQSGVLNEVPGGGVWLSEVQNAKSATMRRRLALGVVLIGVAVFALVIMLTK